MGTTDEPEELTFADVLNGLSRSPRTHEETRAPAPAPARRRADPVEVTVDAAAIVRAYAWTGGRTRSTAQLAIETLISTTRRAEAVLDGLRSEHQAVAQLCRRSKSVAEIGALLSLPIGVVRVLLEDMAAAGLVTVHETSTGPDDRPDVELLHRVLRGLTNLRT
ncbi:DUF742 domain-containing protein [Actinophytocola gossypii]|uniref:DUF742 domain-containing protein n=1 Tax=Actinophytocola gossypii TaxID=2812003 RepID=A0ABT2JC91_9PSEU|nr:DUF742 domain-containing protein [Actinophytocola gossypii]MCT2585488.1 DUF742 domain-containing protein [Actinophytocola gossypii]